MGNHLKAFFCTSSEDAPGHFHSVIAVHETPELTWKEAKKLTPRLPKGWYELTKLSNSDRIEFVRDYWITSLPFHPDLSDFLTKFFGNLSEIGLYITQRTFDDLHEAHLAYGLKNDAGFFQGAPPALEGDVVALSRLFPERPLPPDYLAFLQIHDGFAKFTDTGVTSSSLMGRQYRLFQRLLDDKGEQLLSPQHTPIDHKSLIPFYESFGFPCYQCFWSDWYPGSAMGNVYYSGLTHTISDCKDQSCPENLSFASFTEWLMFYLETMEI